MIRRANWLGTYLCLLVCWTLVACQGPVTEEDLDKWRHNDKGLARIGEVVKDLEQPLATRIRALEVVVENNHPKRIRSMIDEVKEGREELIAGLCKELLDHISKDSDAAVDAKDALIVLQRYIAAEEFAKIRKVIADWAFTGIDWDTPVDDVKQITRKINTGQISDLGKFAWKAQGVLISHGFVVDKMQALLAQAKDPQATTILLKGMEKLHGSVGVRIHHLEAIASTENPNAASYLLDIYLDQNHEEDIRIAAFNHAIAMLDKPDVKKNPATVVQRLLKMVEGKDGQDRWRGALNIIAIEGVKNLDGLIGRFKDDGVYRASDDPAPIRRVMDLCLDIYDMGHSKASIPVFTKHASSENRIIAAMSIVCLKASQAYQAEKALAALRKPKKRGGRPLADFFGEGVSIESLATNAVEGLAMMRQSDADHAAKKIDKIEIENKKMVITFELEKVGKEYAELVSERFEEFRADYKKNPDSYKKEEPKAKPEDPKAKAEEPKKG